MFQHYILHKPVVHVCREEFLIKSTGICFVSVLGDRSVA